eukprot:TRINITY_DN61366_c0_g1_i1.p1 TRINITY_DN61366_c0_g1~~TRINITY_DN61366_c0_g1_i1.p1  ORF type:complete len:105 (+),score=32.74 TRINITY_DN61366_c0_g1_i1:71-385(+)
MGVKRGKQSNETMDVLFERQQAAIAIRAEAERRAAAGLPKIAAAAAPMKNNKKKKQKQKADDGMAVDPGMPAKDSLPKQSKKAAAQEPYFLKKGKKVKKNTLKR